VRVGKGTKKPLRLVQVTKRGWVSRKGGKGEIRGELGNHHFTSTGNVEWERIAILFGGWRSKVVSTRLRGGKEIDRVGLSWTRPALGGNASRDSNVPLCRFGVGGAAVDTVVRYRQAC